MATQTSRTGPSGQAGRGPSAAAVQRRYIEAPLEASPQPIVDAAMNLAELMGTLPRAFLDSQQRELDRMKQYGKEDDPRIASLEASIQQVAVLATTAHREQVRIQRVFGTLGNSDGILHGFVSSTEFAPLPGLTVRLVAPGAGERESLTSITDDDGYYRISGLPTMAPGDAMKRSQSLASQIADWFSGSQAAPDTAAAADNQDIGIVEIWKNDQQVYRDPIPIVIGEGGIFREYVIALNAPEAPSDASPIEPDDSSSRGTKKSSAQRPRKATQKSSKRKK